MSAFDEQDCHLLAKAVEYAWELYLKSKKLTVDNVHVARGAITYAVMEVANQGEKNARLMAKAALPSVDKYAELLNAQRVLK